MPIRLHDFKMPERVVKDSSTASPTFGRYTTGPFEIGYARTIGNSLRRVLLSSIEGWAISAIRLKGAPHEFCAIKGVKEDVTEIVLALKKVLVKCPAPAEDAEDEPRTVTIKRKGPCNITAADIAAEDSAVEVLNPSHHIATVNEDGEFEIEIRITRGRGFCPAQWDPDPNDPAHRRRQTEIGLIPIDRIYSPVARVNFDVANYRIGQQTDYEKLELDVTTDGRVSPDDALVHAANILRSHLDVFTEIQKDASEPSRPTLAEVANQEDLAGKLNLSVNEIELSVRSANCLNNANITTVGELCQRNESDMLKFRNFGKKSLLEIKDKLQQMGLSLGMKFDASVLSQLQ